VSPDRPRFQAGKPAVEHGPDRLAAALDRARYAALRPAAEVASISTKWGLGSRSNGALAAKTTTAPRFCSACGHGRDEGDRFCAGCGRKLA